MSNLREKIVERIRHADGFMPFDEFMALSLYDAEYGYYQQAQVFGEQGDFITGSDMGSWLAMAFANTIADQARQLGGSWLLLEQGGGEGRLLAQVCRFLACLDCQPSRVLAVEQSACFRQRQQAYYQQQQIEVEQYARLSEVVADAPVIVFSNELPDAFPVSCFCWQQQAFFARGVGETDGRLHWHITEQPIPEPPAIDADIMAHWPEGYCSEVNHGLHNWQHQLSRMLSTHGGVVLTLDYGYHQREYYRPNRREGTLMGHHRHQVIEDVLSAEPGQCDLTAHIDFTALASIGERFGLHATAFVTQGGWLASVPLVQQSLQEIAASPSVDSMRQLAHAKRLMLPHAGMGETFKLLIQSTQSALLPPVWLQGMNRLTRLGI